MALDILNYPDLLQVERQLLEREKRDDVGRFGFGEEISTKIGDGLDFDGVREYQPGDEARHINWTRSAQQSVGTLIMNQFFAEQTPMTIVVADTPTQERYANTMGSPWSARSIGYLAAYRALKIAGRDGAPYTALWSNGYKNDKKLKVRTGSTFVKPIMNDGFEYAKDAIAIANSKEKHAKKRRQKKELVLPGTEDFAEVIAKAGRTAQRYADAARFVVISGFEGDIEPVFEQMRKLRLNGEVIGIHVTHPLMYELPDGVTHVDVGGGKRVDLSADSHRRTYSERAQKNFARIQEGLKGATTKGFIELDTMDPRLSKIPGQ